MKTMIIRFWILLLLPVLFLITGCNSCGGGTTKTTNGNDNAVKGDNPAYVVVLCDLSGSVNSEGTQDKAGYTNCLRNIKNACSQLLDAEPPKSHIVFYTVSESATGQPFFIFDVNKANKINKRFVQKLADSCKQRISSIIDSMSKTPETSSCILGSIERTYNIFSKINNSQPYDKKLVILSDLLEDCSYSVAGQVRVRNDKVLTENDKRGLQMVSNYKGNTNFESENVALTIYITSPLMPDPVLKCVDTSWAKTLRNMGFKNLQKPIYNSIIDIKAWGKQ